MSWIYFAVRLLVAFATVAVGLAVVRPVHVPAGRFLALAGAVELFSACATRAAMVAYPSSSTLQVLLFGGTLLNVIYAVLVIAALVGLANAVISRRGQPRAPLEF